MTEASSLLLPRRNENPEFGSGSIFFVGNATLLIRYAGFTILTDPNFLDAGDHAHLGYGLTSTRRINRPRRTKTFPRSISSCSRTCTATPTNSRSPLRTAGLDSH